MSWKKLKLEDSKKSEQFEKDLFNGAVRTLTNALYETTGLADTEARFAKDRLPLGARGRQPRGGKGLKLVHVAPPAPPPPPPKPEPAPKKTPEVKPAKPKAAPAPSRPAPKTLLGANKAVVGSFQAPIAAPLALGSKFQTCDPVYKKYKQDGKDCVTLRHRAFIADVSIDTSNPEIEITAYDLTPMNGGIFPVAPDTAKNYQLWKPGPVHFHFATSVGADKGGVVMMAHQINPNDPIPTTKRELMNFAGAVRNVAWREDHDLHLDASAVNQIGWRNVGRGFSLAANGVGQIPTDQRGELGDVRFDQMGHLLFATAGYDSSAPDIVGELYVDYTFHFKDIAIDSMQENASIISTNVNGANPFGVPGTPEYQWISLPGDLNPTITVNSITPDAAHLAIATPGDYFLTISWYGSGLGAGQTANLVNGGGLIDSSNPNRIAVCGVNSNHNDSYIEGEWLVKVEDPTFTFGFELDKAPLDATSAQFSIMKITPGSMDWRNGIRGYGASETTYTNPAT